MSLASPGADAWPSPQGPRNSGQSARAAGPPMASSTSARRESNLPGLTPFDAWPETESGLRSLLMAVACYANGGMSIMRDGTIECRAWGDLARSCYGESPDVQFMARTWSVSAGQYKFLGVLNSLDMTRKLNHAFLPSAVNSIVPPSATDTCIGNLPL